MDHFFYAIRHKLRFETSKGNLTVEDVNDLPLTAEGDNLSIDYLGKGVTNAIRDNQGNEAFVTVKDSKEDVTLQVKLKILEHIRDHKIDYAARAEKATLTKARKLRLVELLAKKKDEADGEQSIEEIEKMIAEL